MVCRPAEIRRYRPHVTLNPIGTVEIEENRSFIVLNKKYQGGLKDIGDWSHIWVLYWFDRIGNPTTRSTLEDHVGFGVDSRFTDQPKRGVFALRSYYRPNLIAMTPCRLLGVKDNVLELDTIDALPGTPVIDVKPYAPEDVIATARAAKWRGPQAGTTVPGPPSPGGQPFAGRGPPSGGLFQTLDTDRDGVLSAKEIAAAAESLKKLDRDGDGELRPNELFGGVVPPGRPEKN